ncbi:MAG: hypothetical protein IPJ56_05075, partial [Gemmatimonadetes bacterium]|nr:hypothetical protein [Gemmatimonadota bacterium]
MVWLAHSVHGGEASGVEAGLGLLYQLAAGTDAETQMALDSTVVLIDPNQNPDGRERHTHDVERTWSAQGLATEPGRSTMRARGRGRARRTTTSTSIATGSSSRTPSRAGAVVHEVVAARGGRPARAGVERLVLLR